MFHNARIKLTAWYLLIIMFVSLTFSVVLYVDLNRELNRFSNFEHSRRERIHNEFGMLIPKTVVSSMDNQLIMEARNRLILNLFILNLCILAGSTLAGYFLAGKTLLPIKKMMDFQNRFIGDASHELKTPLTALRSEIEVFLRGKKTLPQAVKVLKSNLEETIRLQGLSENLIALSMYEEPDFNYLKFEKIKLLEIINSAEEKVTPLLKKNEVSIKNTVKNVGIFGNRQKLVEFFVILFDNAIKYSKNKTIISISSTINNNLVFIKIQDQGYGISEKDLPHIFERFYRADLSRTKNKIDGYGLGLSIAMQIAKLHNGKISVESKPGKGSTFIVELPLS